MIFLQLSQGLFMNFLQLSQVVFIKQGKGSHSSFSSGCLWEAY